MTVPSAQVPAAESESDRIGPIGRRPLPAGRIPAVLADGFYGLVLRTLSGLSGQVTLRLVDCQAPE